VEQRLRDTLAAIYNGSQTFTSHGWLAEQVKRYVRDEAEAVERVAATGGEGSTASRSHLFPLPPLLDVYPLPPPLFPGVDAYETAMTSGWSALSLVRPVAVQADSPPRRGQGRRTAGAVHVGHWGIEELAVGAVEEALRSACLWAPLT
jgi:hypothetical protein